IKKKIYENISTVLRAVDPELAPESSIDPVVGQVKDFTSLVQVAQREGVALWDCKDGDPQQKSLAKKSFTQIAKYILDATKAKPRSGMRKQG
ncbi:MAG: hypothetical protein K8R46_12250, partial [Pirellulales bacterium]|nr:hypothetical protein [Pirellulales bacterium]